MHAGGLSDKKDLYNKINYRLRRGPNALKEKYNELKDEDPQQLADWCAELLGYKGKYPEEFLTRCKRTIETTDTSGTEGGWFSFRKLAATEGQHKTLTQT